MRRRRAHSRSSFGRTASCEGPTGWRHSTHYLEAAEARTVLELNGSYERLDLDDRRARAALEAGNRFVLDSDAHFVREFDDLDGQSHRLAAHWLETSNVLNTLPLEQFVAQVTGHS